MELVLGLLRELDHLEHLETEAERLVEDDGHQHFERCRGRKARAARQRAVDYDVEAVARFAAGLLEDVDDAHEVVRPVFALVIGQARHRELDDALIRKVHRVDTRRAVITVCHDGIRAERNRAREDVAAVVVGMLADEVDAARGEIAALGLLAELLLEDFLHLCEILFDCLFHGCFLLILTLPCFASALKL